MTDTYRIKKSVAYRFIDGQAVLVDTGTNKMMMLNDTGSDIWQGIQDGKTIAEITASIVHDYEIDNKAAEADVSGFVQTILEKNLVEPGD